MVAPMLFGGFDESGRKFLEGVSHCWVSRQPREASELDAMIETMATQELQRIGQFWRRSERNTQT
jgi:hypothetical protein